ncbi:FecR family protein [Sphingobacterium faecale]|uniref:FecR domain-containing protein n=1 Tax=Sphingobacterium faecale TaxID=2803775 RepID=A0ABS1RC93_9SPHI|nr:FecR family protein [Sphingobacterium faecale]MBL1411461.1 FecR domain-containing protein [Sphingobacterium faecale]
MRRLDKDIWSVLSRALAGESDDEDDSILDEWLLDRNNKEVYDTIQRIRYRVDMEPGIACKEQVLEDVMGKIYDNTSPSKSGHFRVLIFSLAAAAIILVTATISLWLYRTAQPISIVEFTSGSGVSKIVLPDDTRVTLNKGSKVSYLSDFNKKERRLSLKGEAFFDVTRNPDKKFIVSTDRVDIHVLGTSFNLVAYPDRSEVTTTLYTGSLEMQDTHSGDFVRIKPGEEVNYNKQTSRMIVRQFDALRKSHWYREAIVFDAAPFHEVCSVLENTFGVTINFDNRIFSSKRFTGRFNHQESLEEILSIIQTSVPFRYIVSDNIIFINQP